MEFLQVSKKDGLQTVTFNRPEKKNAISAEMFIAIPNILKEAGADPNVRMVAFTGKGDYFTSGSDIGNFVRILLDRKSSRFSNDDKDDADIQQVLRETIDTISSFVSAFIDFPKPIAAVVNGSAVGIGVTILGLFDLVFASDVATFHCPFTTLGLSPEGCSTYTFSCLMGHSKAAEMLIFGRKISAIEAFNRNLVTEVVPHQNMSDVWNRLQDIATLQPGTLVNAKFIMKKNSIAALHKINNDECDALMKQFTSEEFLEAITNFVPAKSKL